MAFRQTESRYDAPHARTQRHDRRSRASGGNTRPALTSKAEADKQARIEREAKALRENLRRRKQQMRDRKEAERKPE